MEGRGGKEPLAWRPLSAVAAAVTLCLVAGSGGYGYHRDELYFIAAGARPALGYADQPPLVPLLAWAVDTVSGGSLVALRLPAALAAGLVVLVTGLLAHEFGARRSGQLLAAAAMGVSALLFAVGHMLSTAILDLLVWTVLCWLVARALRGDTRAWLWAGAVAGLGLQVKSLVLFLLAALLIGLVCCGPRGVFRERTLWWGAALAVLLWSPNLWWQATNGWPQLELSTAIAQGSSGTSEPRWLFLPFQLVLIGPMLAPIWIMGLVRLLKDPQLRVWRVFAVAYLLLAAVFLITGGKPYYLGGMYPVLLAAGALWWQEQLQARGDRVYAGAALGVTAVSSVVLMLPVVPAGQLAKTPILAINYDAGETVGWPAFAATVNEVYQSVEQPGAVVLTGNYGEAGAVEKYLPGLPVYSGHNSYWQWGPPVEEGPAIVVGYAEESLRQWCGSLTQAATIDNGLGLNNDEQGQPVWLCEDRADRWEALWPHMRRVG